MPLVAKRILDVIGDMKVHFVTKDAMRELTGSDTPYGVYDPVQNHIVVGLHSGTEAYPHVMLHEAIHGAIYHYLEANPRFKEAMTKVMNIAKDNLTNKDKSVQHVEYSKSEVNWQKQYGFTDVHEFISEALSNPLFQRRMAEIKINETLGNELGIPKFRQQSLWSAFVSRVRRILNLPEYTHTALEAALSTFDRLTVNRTHEVRNKELLRKIDELSQLSSRPQYLKDFGDVDGHVTSAGNKTREILSRIRSGLRSGADNLSTFGMLARRGDEIFGGADKNPLRQVHEFAQMMRVEKNDILKNEGGARVVENLARLQKQFHDGTPDSEWSKAVKVAYEATVNNITPWLGKDQFKGNSRSEIQAKKAYNKLSSEFQRLDPDLQKGIIQANNFFKNQQNTRAFETIQSLLKRAGYDEPRLAEMIFKDELTAEGLKNKFGNDAFIKALNNASDLKEIKGAYFPMRRYGNWVVNATRNIETPEGATKVDGAHDTIQFTPKDETTAAYKEAQDKVRDYLGSTDERAMSVKDVWVKKDDPNQLTEPEDIDGVKATRIRLHSQITEFHENQYKAQQREAELRLDPNLTVRGVERRDNTQAGKNADLMSSQMQTLVRQLQKQENFQNLSPEGKADLIKALEESTLHMRAGTRIQGTQLQRRNIEGFSNDLIRATSEYADMSAGYLARLRHMPDAEKALDEAKAYAKARYTESENTPRRSELLQEVEKRLYSANDHIETGAVNAVTRRLLQASMLDKLGGVSFHIINSQEPWMVAAPYMAGKHGLGDVVTRLGNAYSILGARSLFKQGVVDTGKAFFNTHGFTDYIQSFKDNIKANVEDKTRAQAYSDLLDHLHKRGLLDDEAEFEVRYLAHPESNMLLRGLDRAELMSRQIGTAVESINRAVTGISAYDLEMNRTGDHAKSMRYAYDVVHDTMGDYSRSNSAPIFNHPLGKVALQFRKFGQKMYYLLGSTFKGMLAGDKEATRQFMGVMFTHAAMAGVLGLPLEPIKAALIGANVLGVTDYSWDDFEHLVRSSITDVAGNQAGEVISRGLPHLAGFDISQRVGLDSLLTHSAPRSDKQSALKEYLFDTLAGAPASLVLQLADGTKALMSGDAIGATKLLPVKAVHDIVAAGQGFASGKQTSRGHEAMSPFDAGEALYKAIGLKPSREAETQELRNMNYSATTKQKAQRDDLVKLWVTSDPAERQKVWGRIEAWNHGRPLDARLTRSQLQDEVDRRRRNNDNGRMEHGQSVNKYNRYIVEQNRSIYNVR